MARGIEVEVEEDEEEEEGEPGGIHIIDGRGEESSIHHIKKRRAVFIMMT